MLILALLALALIVHLGMVVGVAEIAVHPPVMRRPCDTDGMALNVAAAVGAAAELVKIRASDDVTLSAWWLRLPASTKAVLLCHGVADTAFGVMGAALMFLGNGYSVLAPDNRGHGGSGGFVTYGVREAGDIARWQGWMADHGAGECYGFGESLGASSLLQSLNAGAEFRGVVAECPFSSFQGVAFDRVLRITSQFLPHPLSRWASHVWVSEILYYLRLRHGVDLRLARFPNVNGSAKTPILLIHGTADHETPVHHSEQIAAACPGQAQVWLVPGAEHTGACAAAPVEFAERVMALLTSSKDFK